MVFAAELDRTRFPIRTRLWGIFVASVLLVSICVAMISPRTIAVSLPIFGLSLLASVLAQGKSLAAALLRAGRRAGAPAAFVGFAVASALWAGLPVASLKASLAAAAWLCLCVFLVAAIASEPRRAAFHMAEGLWIGLIVGLLYLLAEILSHQAIKIFLYNAFHVPKSWLRPAGSFIWANGKVVAISPMDLTRSIAPTSLLMWSSLLCLRVTAPRQQVWLWSAALFSLCVLVVGISEHETSKVALLISSAIFLLSYWNAKLCGWLLRLVWIGACLSIVPVALALHRLDLQHARWVQPSMQHRIIIWNYTAEQSLQSPVLGVGAGMMYELDPGESVKIGGEQYAANARHAHNVYLQTWFEFGAIGALLMTVIGLGIIGQLSELRPEHISFAHATFAAAMTMAAASYGMWQAWFEAMFVLTVACFALAVRVHTRTDD